MAKCMENITAVKSWIGLVPSDNWSWSVQSGCPSCHPNSNVKYWRKLNALVLIQEDHSSDLICSWSTDPLLTEAGMGSPSSVRFGQTPHTAYNTSAFIASFSFTKNRQERGKFVSLLVVSRLESIQLQAGFTPDQGLCPTPLGANPQTSIIG